jgi:hypothetical protein
MLRVGVSYNFDSGAFDAHMLGAGEVESLLFGHRLHGRTLTGWEHGMSVSPEGTAVMFGGWGTGAATAELVGDGVCFVRSTTRNCGRILRNPGGTRVTENEYIWFTSPDAYPFSQLE